MTTNIYIFVFVNLFVLSVTKRLVQVVILSRHNVRAPLTGNLEHFSPNSWPVWLYEPGDLTANGALLEEYMGEYISDWLRKEKLLGNVCPVEDDVYVYANTRHRTRESAKAFVIGAFRNCSVIVHVINSEDMDPVFNPVFRNTSEELKTEIISEMQRHLDELQLRDVYLELEDIVDLKKSPFCVYNNMCSFANTKDSVYYEIGEEPNIIGPLAQGNSIVDSFIMSYYERMRLDKVAWGKIKTPEQWNSLTKITKANQYVRFKSPILSKEVAKPMIDYLSTIFLNEKPPKFTLLHGHDSNLNSVMAAMGFKSFVLPDQYETTPLGGKLVWQKWHDDELNRDLLKVNFVYQSTGQLRNATKLSEQNPALWVTLEMEGCPVDQNDYCDWANFVNILRLIN